MRLRCLQTFANQVYVLLWGFNAFIGLLLEAVQNIDPLGYLTLPYFLDGGIYGPLVADSVFRKRIVATACSWGFIFTSPRPFEGSRFFVIHLGDQLTSGQPANG